MRHLGRLSLRSAVARGGTVRAENLLPALSGAGRVEQVRYRFHGPTGAYKPPGKARTAMSLPVDSPEFAEEMNALAKAAHQARNFDDAVALYDRVLAHRRSKHGLFHEEVAATLHNLGRVFIDARSYAAAENALTEAAAIYEQRGGKCSLKYAESLALLALCYRDLKFLEPAEKTFKDALQVFKDHCYDHVNHSWIPKDRVPPPVPNESPLSSVAHLLSDTAVLFMNRDENHRAVVFLEEALEIRRFLYGHSEKFKPIIAQTLVKLAEVKRAMGEVDIALELVGECIRICLQTMGRESPATAAAISSKGNILAAKQQFIEAKKCYEEACTTYAMAYGKESALVASEMMHVGRMMEFTNEFGEAEAKYVRASEITRQRLGNDSIALADANLYLATLVMKKADFDRAVPLLRDAIRIRSMYNTNDPQLVFIYHKLGDALAAKKDAEAEAQFLTAIEIHKANHEKTQKDTPLLLMTDVMDDLALFYLQFHMPEKAEALMQESLKVRLEKLGDTHQMAGYSYSNLSLLYLDQKQYLDCIRVCKSALTIYDKAGGRESPMLAVTDVYYTLGQAFMGLKDYGEAGKAFTKCLQMRRTQGEQADIQVAETLHEIAKLHLETGDTFQAATEVDEAYKLAAKYPQLTSDLMQALERTKRSFPAVAAGKGASR